MYNKYTGIKTEGRKRTLAVFAPRTSTLISSLLLSNANNANAVITNGRGALDRRSTVSMSEKEDGTDRQMKPLKLQ